MKTGSQQSLPLQPQASSGCLSRSSRRPSRPPCSQELGAAGISAQLQKQPQGSFPICFGVCGGVGRNKQTKNKLALRWFFFLSLGGMMFFLRGGRHQRGLFGKWTQFVCLSFACACENPHTWAQGFQIHQGGTPVNRKITPQDEELSWKLTLEAGREPVLTARKQWSRPYVGIKKIPNKEVICPKVLLGEDINTSHLWIPKAQYISTGGGGVYCVQRTGDPENSGTREIHSPLSSTPPALG